MAEGLDLGVVHGELELTDNFTKRLFTAAQALKDVEDKVAATGKKGVGVFDAMSGAAAKMAGALGIGLGIGAVVSFGQHLLELGDNIQRVSDRTGLSTDEVQRLGFIAGQSGNQLEDLTIAIGAMQVRLNDPKSQAALKDIGVDLDALAKKGPYDQMVAIAEAIALIPNPAAQADAAMAAFGRGGLAILPTLKAKFKETGEAATLMSRESVAALDRLGDRLAAWKTNAVGAVGETVGTIVQGGEQLAKVGLLATLESFIKNGGPATLVMFGQVAAAAEAAAAKAAAVKAPVPELSAVEAYRKHLNELIRSHISLTAEQKAAVRVAQALGEANDKIAAALKVDTSVVDDYTAAVKQAAADQKTLHDAQAAITDELFGINATEKAGNYARALGNVSNVSKLTAEKQAELHTIFVEAVHVYELTGRATDELALKYKALAAATSGATTAAWIKSEQDKQAALNATYADADAKSRQRKKDLDDERERTDALTRAAQALLRAQGGSVAITSQNLSNAARSLGVSDSGAAALAGQGYSFEEIVAILRGGPKGPPRGPAIPGYERAASAGGGPAAAGPGPAAASSGRGSALAPPPPPTRGAGAPQFNFYVNGTGAQVADEVSRILMDRTKTGTLLG